jgi:ubiquinone/menaquinone biosynthesis C-methylase UbiE
LIADDPSNDRLRVTDPWEILKLLSDRTRLRVLKLLQLEELSVAELQEILEMGQSRISSHLSLLRQGNLVQDRKEGKRTYYVLRLDELPAKLRPLLQASLHAVESDPEIRADRINLDRILERRRRITEEYFSSVAGKLEKHYCPGRSWEAYGQLLLYLTPHWKIADLGAGEAALSLLLARHAKQVYCIDNNPRMVEVGTALLKKNGLDNVSYLLGDIEKVPLPDRSVDLVILSQALHHASKPIKVLEESWRILKSGGRVLILDLKEHQFEKAHELYADTWLGFKENFLFQSLKDSGFQHVEVRTVFKEAVEPYFETLLAYGVK